MEIKAALCDWIFWENRYVLGIGTVAVWLETIFKLLKYAIWLNMSETVVASRELNPSVPSKIT